MTLSLFAAAREELVPGCTLLRGFADSAALRAAIEAVAIVAPFRHMTTPGGFRMSVAMTNCGAVGWVTDRTGYRYSAIDPETGGAWPAMPAAFRALAVAAASTCGFAGFAPDACLVNRYAPGAKMSLHQDKDERDFTQPIVSVSLGLPATFMFGGATRKDTPLRVALHDGDVVVFGGPARLCYHGIAPLAAGTLPYRFNLTFRQT